MTFTKKKLAAAIGGTLLASVGIQQAHAVVELDSTANAGVLYASEIVIGTAGVGLSHVDVMDLNGVVAVNGVQNDTDIRVTLTLSSGTFTGVPTMTIDSNGAGGNGCKGTAATALACAATTLFSGGTTADSTVTFNTSVGALASEVIPGAHFLFAMNGVTVPNQSAVTATVTATIADNFGSTPLSTTTGPYISFGPLLSLTADREAGQAIDVAQNSLFFANTANTGDNAVNVGGALVTVDVAAPVPLSVASTAINATHIITSAQHTITAANGFSAFNQGTAVAGESVQVGGVTAAFSTADATLATVATAAVVATGDGAGNKDVVLTAPAANTVAIAETTLTDTIAIVGAATATYSTATSTGTVALASLSRNGSTARLTFSVNPDSAYPMSIRVTNDSAVVGPTTLTLTNDDGLTSAAIDITAIAGGPAANLATGASTALLSIADVFAAVQAADATFALGATNKLRVDVSSLTPSIILNAFSLSSDGTTFSMVTDAGA
jgi:hypothetical protein